MRKLIAKSTTPNIKAPKPKIIWHLNNQESWVQDNPQPPKRGDKAAQVFLS